MLDPITSPRGTPTIAASAKPRNILSIVKRKLPGSPYREFPPISETYNLRAILVTGDKIRAIATESEDVRRLMTIKGVDFYLASLTSSYIGNVNRFSDDNHLASFLGIVPESRDSSNVKRRGRMSKEGPATARWAFSIMTDTVMRYNPQFKLYYLSVKKRKSSGALAHVAAMRKLARMIDHMLKYKENLKWEDKASTVRKLAELDNYDDDAGGRKMKGAT